MQVGKEQWLMCSSSVVEKRGRVMKKKGNETDGDDT